mmetsp:Transcript_15861/g.23886  ORF Transcript_15861/g.23886 Transcript_15861/m.23886 type:complete len:200 (-) Transcript_15861:232-831(-)
MPSIALKLVPLFGIALMYAEINFLPGIIRNAVGGNTLVLNLLSLPRAYGCVIIVNVIMSSLLIVSLGFKVGAARKKYAEKALKDGEENAEERYSLPNMYVTGGTENARRFNCIQRGHQQALETYSQFLALSLTAGLRFPLFTSVCGLVWMYARKKWAEGYATGDPASRYSHWAGMFIWHSLICLLCAATGSALGILEII